MEIRILNKGIVIFEEGSQAEVVRLPLAGYDVIELVYFKEIYKTLVSSEISAETASEISGAIEQINEVISEKCVAANLGLLGSNIDVIG